MSRYAFVSVSNRAGLLPLARKLVDTHGFELICSDGTYKYLTEEGGVKGCHTIASMTGFPEMLGGRVKSLHPKIFGGILADFDEKSHVADVDKHQLPRIELVVCNFYPFSRSESNLDKAVALMDIGGVSVVRAAAKNFKHVTVLSDPSQYDLLLKAESVSLQQRKELAQSAFQLTSSYDHDISSYLLESSSDGVTSTTAPSVFSRRYEKVCDLKYGCNPHQLPAALYKHGEAPPSMKLLNGKWGYINILDAVNAWGLVSEITRETGLVSASSFKHTMPAGAAVGSSWADLSAETQKILSLYFGLNESTPSNVIAYARARNADPLCSFGDFIGISGTVDVELAKFIGNQIADGIVAGGYTDEALEILSRKKKGSFVVIQQDETSPNSGDSLELRDIGSGLALAQAPNTHSLSDKYFNQELPTKVRRIPASSRTDLVLANATIRYAESNSIAAACGGQVIGVAAGQQSRVDAVRLVAEKARVYFNRHGAAGVAAFESATGAKQDRIVTATNTAKELPGVEELGLVVSMASDGFFPFSDGIDEAAKIPGLKFMSQPGGSARDGDVIEACNAHGIGMALTGIRVFSH